jgi:flagellar biosynthesis protein FlhB
VAIFASARAARTALGDSVAAACDGRATLAPSSVTAVVLTVAAPVVGICALAALAAHFAQTRRLWAPRRRVTGAPSQPKRRGLLDLAAGVAVAAVGLGWLWIAAPGLARLIAILDPLTAAATLLGGLGVALVVAWIVAGAIDAISRHVALSGALAMTPAEKREDDRLASIDQRWRRRRAEPELAGATLVVLGDDVAVAIAWDPVRRPIPARIAAGRGARATQLLGLARRHRIPVHRDNELARALDGMGDVPRARWARLAEIIAATHRHS